MIRVPRVSKLLFARDKVWCPIIIIKASFRRITRWRLQPSSLHSRRSSLRAQAVDCGLHLQPHGPRLRSHHPGFLHPDGKDGARQMQTVRCCSLPSFKPIRVFISRLASPRLDIEINYLARTVTISTPGMPRRHQAVHYRLGTYVSKNSHSLTSLFPNYFIYRAGLSPSSSFSCFATSPIQ